jgi:hypothetical protein
VRGASCAFIDAVMSEMICSLRVIASSTINIKHRRLWRQRGVCSNRQARDFEPTASATLKSADDGPSGWDVSARQTNLDLRERHPAGVRVVREKEYHFGC